MLHDGEISWACLFGLLAWRLWKNQNLFIFQKKSWSSSKIIKVSMCWAKQSSLAPRDELWGILDGLKLIQRRGHSNVVIHSDSLEVVKAFHGNVSKISDSALIRRIHRILSQESHWTLRYIPREENQCADYLAKLAFERKEDLQLVETPPDA
ncbi:hypothetical protein Golob_024705, partial [Gossypium lobatum]|nr:hypothetical protein [Gossypium lobatum]